MAKSFAIWQKRNQPVCQLALERLSLPAQNCRMAMTAIRKFRTGKNLSLEVLAGDAGISVSQLSRIETGKREPKLADLERIAGALGVEVQALLRETSVQKVPLISWVSAGRMGQADPVPEGERLQSVTVADLEPGHWVALEVVGRSMDRIAPDGSIILVNRDDTRLIPNKFYVFAYSDGQSTFKRYKSNPARFVPFSFDPDEETIYPDDEWRVFGRVRRVITDLK